MRLYRSDNTRSFRALRALEEVGAAYEPVTLGFPPEADDPVRLDGAIGMPAR